MSNVPFSPREQLLIDTAVRESQRRANRAQSAAISAAGSLLEESATVPSGTIAFWPDATPPDGWLACDGAAVSRTTYAALFAIIAEVFGPGDASTTFNLPDLQGRVPVMVDGATFAAIADDGGAETVTLDTTMIPAHTHTYTSPDAPQNQLTVGLVAGVIETRTAATATSSTGGGAAHNNLQPYLVLNGIIKT